MTASTLGGANGIDLGGALYGIPGTDDLAYPRYTAFSGSLLTVTDGGSTVAQLHFSGSYATSIFHLGSDNHGGTRITHT